MRGWRRLLRWQRCMLSRHRSCARRSRYPRNNGDVCVKYQPPGEDLDALVYITNDEDLEHLVHEYDRFHRQRPATASSASNGSGSNRGGSAFPLAPFVLTADVGRGRHPPCFK